MTIGRISGIQQIISFQLASGNRCETLYRLLKKDASSKSIFKVQEVPEDVIFNDEEQRKEMNEKMEKLKSGSCTKSNREDLTKENGDDIH